jgi:hypothetical protein
MKRKENTQKRHKQLSSKLLKESFSPFFHPKRLEQDEAAKAFH